ncbi:hypothetical protein AUJ84_02680 [Candidatus Pacearchaeota archaeon CG1_02_32_132]|nr:MAG: hypothetical protein AUJ84_02680 [Candidatus Pacearchaeota archaeon CG1_02_32_132]
MGKLIRIAPFVVASIVGLSCEKKQEANTSQNSSQAVQDDESSLEKLIKEHQNYLDVGDIGKFLAWSSQGDFSSLLNVQNLYVDEGTTDCYWCNTNAPEFKRIAEKYEGITIDNPNLVGFVELDVGKLADGFLRSTITEGENVPKYSYWKNTGQKFELVRMAENLSDLESLASGVVGMKADTKTEGGFVKEGVFVASHAVEYDSPLILNRIVQNPESISYKDGVFVVSYDWNSKDERFLALRSKSLRQRGASFYGAKELADIDRAFVDARWDKIFNPRIEDGKGISVDINDYGLRPALEILAEIPRVLFGDDLKWYNESFPKFSPERILTEGKLREEIISLDEEGMEVKEGYTDVSDFINLAGGWVPMYYRNVLGLNPRQISSSIAMARKVQSENFVVVPEAYRELYQGYLESAGRFGGYSLPSEEETRKALEKINGKKDSFFDAESRKLLDDRNYIEMTLRDFKELGVSVYYAGQGEDNARVGVENASVSVYFGASLDSVESLRERAGLIERLHEKLSKHDINYGIIDIPPKFAGFFPIDIGAGNLLRDFIPTSEDPSRVYAVFRNGKPVNFGHLSVKGSEENIYNLVESFYGENGEEIYNDN